VSDLVAGEVREMNGDLALPRLNGELVFEAPWQGRALGLAIGVTKALGIDWDRFRQELIRAIAADPDRAYYDSWICALEALVVDENIATVDELHRHCCVD
jgi:hypothetical protein